MPRQSTSLDLQLDRHPSTLDAPEAVLAAPESMVNCTSGNEILKKVREKLN